MATGPNGPTNNQSNSTADNTVQSAIQSAQDENRLTVASVTDLCSESGVVIPNSPNPVVVLKPAIVHRRCRIVIRHTSTPSAAASPAPASSPGAMTPMFDSAEHSMIGNDILLSYPGSSGVWSSATPLPLPNGLQLTFGQIVSLGGDFFGDINSSNDVQEISDGPNPAVFLASFDALATDEDAVDVVPAILGIMQQEIDAINQAIAAGKEPSTAYAGLDLDGQYNVVTGGGTPRNPEVPPGTYEKLAQVNWDHFGPNAIKAYKAGHAAAIQQAITAKSASGNSAQIAALNLAYAMDAFACHFLTDLFASGHMRTPRKFLYEDVPTPLAGSFCAKAMHDEDNYFGLIVTNNPVNHSVPKRTWKAFGDARLFDTVDLTNLTYVIGATQQSANEVYGAFTNGTAPAFYGALDAVVDLTQFSNQTDQTNTAALFYVSAMVSYAREDYVNETDYEWTDAWLSWNALRTIGSHPNYANYPPPLNKISPPTTAITSLTDFTVTVPAGPWIAGSKVRYAVSFYDQNTGNESELGPWMLWFTITSVGCPTLGGIPTCPNPPAGMNIGRKVYRQIMNSSGVCTRSEPILIIANNTATQGEDTSA